MKHRPPHWNADHQTVEFGVEIDEYRGVVRVPRRAFQWLLPQRPRFFEQLGAQLARSTTKFSLLELLAVGISPANLIPGAPQARQ